jgi:hypothetical protein
MLILKKNTDEAHYLNLKKAYTSKPNQGSGELGTFSLILKPF